MLEAVLATFRQGKRPILVGSPGQGKTSFARNLEHKLGCKVHVINLSHREGSEVHGQPVVSRELFQVAEQKLPVVVQSPPSYVRDIIAENRKCVIVYDELNTASQQVQSPVLSIMSDHCIGEVNLPYNRVAIMACTNQVELAAGGWDLAPAMANRLRFIPFEATPLEWVENFPAYWGKPPRLEFFGAPMPEQLWERKRILVASFIRQFPDLLTRVPEDVAARSGPWPSPRTWDAVSGALAIAEDEKLAERELKLMVYGDVGQGAALQFFNWLDTMALPDPRELVDRPENFRLPERSDQLFYIVVSCVQEAKHRKDKATGSSSKKLQDAAIQAWYNVWKMLSMILAADGPKDISTLGANMLAKKDNMPRGARPPVEVDQFMPVLRAAGVDYSV